MKKRYMIVKAQYEAALNLCDWEWADRLAGELKQAKEDYEQWLLASK
ncbi:hypothetical protein [Paenibacillus macerans]|nr:hypothetical protein [Paenibacillus macerans]MCM3701408.1 hypothetical protein [Paenibacillus macerans]MCM3703814.1 hypothetical protein [Paenibacillus macerans]